jgi:hypothetical protein
MDEAPCTLELKLDFPLIDVVFEILEKLELDFLLLDVVFEILAELELDFLLLDVVFEILEELFAELDALGLEVGVTEVLMLRDKFLEEDKDRELLFELDLDILLLKADVLEDFAVVE